MEFALNLGHLDSEILRAEKLLKTSDTLAGVTVLVNVVEKIKELQMKGCSPGEEKELDSRRSKCVNLISSRSMAVSNSLEAMVMSQPGRRVNVEDLVMPSDDDVHLGDIVGMEEAKMALTQAALIPNAFDCPLAADYNWRGILLFGPSGVGKSKVVRGFVNSLSKFTDIHITFLNVTLDQVCGSFHGDTERNLTAVFQAAESKSPCILLFDEIDALCGSRDKEKHESNLRITNHFLSVLDGLKAKAPVVVVGTTNKIYAMDTAFYRRFQKMIYVELPSKVIREKILRQFLDNIQAPKASIDIDFSSLACLTYRYSPADLVTLVTEAAQYVTCERLGEDILKTIESGKKMKFHAGQEKQRKQLKMKPIRNEDLFRALRKVKPTNSESEIAKLEMFASSYCNTSIQYEDIPSDWDICTADECRKNPFSAAANGACFIFNLLFGDCM